VNPDVTIEGILMTMFDARTNLSRLVVDEVRRVFGDLVYGTLIPRNVALSEAPGHERSVLEYAPHSAGSRAYRELAAEFLRRQTTTARAPDPAAESVEIPGSPADPVIVGT
jgi:chromosome partitioning protein